MSPTGISPDRPGLSAEPHVPTDSNGDGNSIRVTRSLDPPTLRYSVRVLADCRDLEELVPEWEELALNAVEPSPSSEWWMLIPAIRTALPGEQVSVVMVFVSEVSPTPSQQSLCAVFPIETRASIAGIPARVVRLWNHIYALSSAPLLRREHAPDSIRAFMRWVSSGHFRPAILDVPEIRIDSSFLQHLREIVAADGLTHTFSDVWARAVFYPMRDADQYLASISTTHHRHEWRRQERRLAEHGSLGYDALQPGDDASAWLAEFMNLELSGWKGREGSAFACNPAHRRWLLEVGTEAAKRGRLMMSALRLDGKAIAMKLNFLAPPGSYAFKIAYDERYLKFSPGVLLELQNVRHLHGMREIVWMDSLASPNHPLMDRVWAHRTGVLSMLVAPRRVTPSLLLLFVALLRTVKRNWRKRRTAAGLGEPA